MTHQQEPRSPTRETLHPRIWAMLHLKLRHGKPYNITSIVWSISSRWNSSRLWVSNIQEHDIYLTSGSKQWPIKLSLKGSSVLTRWESKLSGIGNCGLNSKLSIASFDFLPSLDVSSVPYEKGTFWYSLPMDFCLLLIYAITQRNIELKTPRNMCLSHDK